MVRGPRKLAEFIPDGLQDVLAYGYYPALLAGLIATVVVLYRVALPDPIPSHRLIFGATLASVAFVIATLGLRIYLRYITGTGYTYGALATPIAFLLFAFFAGFSIMLGAEFNAAIQGNRRLRGRMPTGCDGGWSSAPRGGQDSHAATDDESHPPRTPTGSALLERLVDPFAVRAHRRAGFGRLGDRKDLAAQRHDMRAHHGALGDLFLLDVVEELRGVAVGPVVDAFVGVGALDRLGVHVTYCAGTGSAAVRQTVDTVE